MRVSAAMLAALWLVTSSYADDPKPETMDVRGVVVPARSVTITSATPGRVVSVHVEEGQAVKQGDVLVRLESIRQELDVKQAEVRIEMAKVRLDQLKNGTRAENRAAAKAEVVAAEAHVGQAQAQLARLRRLKENGAVSVEEVAAAEAALLQARALLDKQKAVLQALEAGASRDELRLAELEVRATQLARERALVALDACTIRAPFAGTIIRLRVQPGDFTNPGMVGLASSAGLCELADLSEPRVEAAVPEKLFSQVKPGMACEVGIDAYPGKAFKATVERVAPLIDTAKNTVKVRVRLAETKVTIPPGATATVKFAGRP